MANRIYKNKAKIASDAVDLALKTKQSEANSNFSKSYASIVGKMLKTALECTLRNIKTESEKREKA